MQLQEITGVFMRNCTLNYSSYRNIFPIWALGEYRRRVLSAQTPNAAPWIVTAHYLNDNRLYTSSYEIIIWLLFFLQFIKIYVNVVHFTISLSSTISSITVSIFISDIYYVIYSFSLFSSKWHLYFQFYMPFNILDLDYISHPDDVYMYTHWKSVWTD
jgi:hypothetical protein